MPHHSRFDPDFEYFNMKYLKIILLEIIRKYGFSRCALHDMVDGCSVSDDSNSGEMVATPARGKTGTKNLREV